MLTPQLDARIIADPFSSDSTSDQPSHNASPKSLQSDRESKDASPDHQQDHGRSIGEDRCNIPRASLALGRYLAHPQSHEMRALGLATSAALSGTRLTTPDRPGVTEAPRSLDSSVRDGVAAPACNGAKVSSTECYTEGLIDPDVSISLSPSPPACSSPEYDAEANTDLRGLATKLKRYVSSTFHHASMVC